MCQPLLPSQTNFPRLSILYKRFLGGRLIVNVWSNDVQSEIISTERLALYSDYLGVSYTYLEISSDSENYSGFAAGETSEQFAGVNNI